MKKKATSNKDDGLIGLQPIEEIIDEMVKAGLSRKEIIDDLKLEKESLEDYQHNDYYYAKILFGKAYYAGLRVSFK